MDSVNNHAYSAFSVNTLRHTSRFPQMITTISSTPISRAGRLCPLAAASGFSTAALRLATISAAAPPLRPGPSRSSAASGLS